MELKCYPKDNYRGDSGPKSGNIVFLFVFEGQAEHEKEETDTNQTEHCNTITQELEGRISIHLINYMKSWRKASMKMCLVSSTIRSDNIEAIVLSSVAFGWNHTLTQPCLHSPSSPSLVS